ncbi:isopenicillin N synthase family oxygenase [Alphaproteobacteria bacterium]|nr:isopenicillin N synthase family oxygenase [Alphaproteobacteria bacterium]
MASIPIISISPLFAAHKGTKSVDEAIAKAAFDIGFMIVNGHPSELPVGQFERELLLKIFELTDEDARSLWKRNFAPENEHIYRGWFPLSSSKARNREGFEIGPDILRAIPAGCNDDLLYEATPFPSESQLPDGWRVAAKGYYSGMERIGNAILASISRSLHISETIFEDAFRDGISTLRLLHYPGRDQQEQLPEDVPDRNVEIGGVRKEQVSRAHVDSGLLTILAVCGVDGLQVQNSDGNWQDVPLVEDSFVINFGGLLERWIGGKIKATRHRVIGQNQKRYSVPFFFEPRPSTLIEPLPITGIEPFEPFLYGDHLWATTTKFIENYGLEHLRPPRAPYTDPLAS